MPKKGAFVIFGMDGEANSETFPDLTSELLRLKEKGISKEKIIFLVEEVYKND